MIVHEINRLVNYALQHQLLTQRERMYSINLLLDVFGIYEFEDAEIEEHLALPDMILNAMLNYAIEHNLIEDNITEKDLFDTRIMNCVMPRPAYVEEQFWKQYKQSPSCATSFYYAFSIASNYIRKARVDKDQKWIGQSAYGPLHITINLSKPEKDPKEIARLKNVVSTSYPKCAICSENEGFAGDYKHAARQSIRLISLRLHEDTYFLQYSPYVYYQEHCIILNAQHKPMQINAQTFENLIAFLALFPHYFIGSNADLPIVGGSILSHDHYQGGCFKFPMEDAQCLKQYYVDGYVDVKIHHVHWPLSTIRLQSEHASSLIACATHILEVWKTYDDESVAIVSQDQKERHNTITPIARIKDGQYELDLVLRNNRVSKEYPLGIFHPHQDVHHIKKENIGLIEVMGLAVLPARLKVELADIQALLEGKQLEEDALQRIEKHHAWIEHLQATIKQNKIEDYKALLEEEVSNIFVRVLEDCGVFKQNVQGIAAFDTFMRTL